MIKKYYTDKKYLRKYQTALEYRNKGYAVLWDVSLDFFEDYKIDLLASKNNENNVAIVVALQSELRQNSKIIDLLNVIREKEGWSFAVTLVAEPEVLEAPENVRPLTGEEIHRLILNSELLLEKGYTEAAFMIAWSALEATLRDAISMRFNESEFRVVETSFILSQAVSLGGIITINEYNKLTQMQNIEEAVIGGFFAEDLTESSVTDLISTVREIALSAGIVSLIQV